MTEEQTKNAQAIVDKINNALSDDKCFESARYMRWGLNKIEFSASLKQAPGYKYVSCDLTLDDLTDVDGIATQLIDDWRNATSPKDIKRFSDFITFGEKYGWD